MERLSDNLVRKKVGKSHEAEEETVLVNQHGLDVLSGRSPTTITAGTTYQSLLLRSVSNHHCV